MLKFLDQSHGDIAFDRLTRCIGGRDQDRNRFTHDVIATLSRDFDRQLPHRFGDGDDGGTTDSILGDGHREVHHRTDHIASILLDLHQTFLVEGEQFAVTILESNDERGPGQGFSEPGLARDGGVNHFSANMDQLLRLDAKIDGQRREILDDECATSHGTVRAAHHDGPGSVRGVEGECEGICDGP